MSAWTRDDKKRESLLEDLSDGLGQVVKESALRASLREAAGGVTKLEFVDVAFMARGEVLRVLAYADALRAVVERLHMVGDTVDFSEAEEVHVMSSGGCVRPACRREAGGGRVVHSEPEPAGDDEDTYGEDPLGGSMTL